MRISRLTKQFKRNYKKQKRSRGNKIEKLHAVVDQLVDGKILAPRYRDHALHGNWRGCRDCHIDGDWILIYELCVNESGQEVVVFHATDNHENLFG